MLNVDTSTLDMISRSLKNISEELLVQSNVMENIMQGIEDAWIGNNSYKYIQKSESIKNSITDTSYNILSLSNDIQLISRQVRQAEDMLENQINNL